MRKYITEFIGTFFLVVTVGMVAQYPGVAPFAIGSVLMVMVYAGGHISGAHYNPAVTLAVLIRGKINIADAIAYWIVQFAAAVAASYLALYFLDDRTPVLGPDLDNNIMALVAELFATFALAYVVLNVATAKGNTGNSFYGLAIGFTVLTMAYSIGSISKGAFNPAVAVGISFMKYVSWNSIWVYLVGCFGGAALAAIVFNYLNKEDQSVPPIPES
jgi:aquaporin Z